MYISCILKCTFLIGVHYLISTTKVVDTYLTVLGVKHITWIEIRGKEELKECNSGMWNIILLSAIHISNTVLKAHDRIIGFQSEADWEIQLF